jgi:hypothetical protein
LAENREPTQPNQRIQPHITRPIIEPWQTEHGLQSSPWEEAIQTGKVTLAPTARMRDIRRKISE